MGKKNRKNKPTETVAESAEETVTETAEETSSEEILIEPGARTPAALLPLRELVSPRAFFRRTFKMDRFSVLTADNKYKL
ncbi:MAG: hypothetical protein LBL87_01815, partial [Ruminococcus sp.]|nr:hypothetical protein [Ruminococcus sp.]